MPVIFFGILTPQAKDQILLVPELTYFKTSTSFTSVLKRSCFAAPPDIHFLVQLKDFLQYNPFDKKTHNNLQSSLTLLVKKGPGLFPLFFHQAIIDFIRRDYLFSFFFKSIFLISILFI